MIYWSSSETLLLVFLIVINRYIKALEAIRKFRQEQVGFCHVRYLQYNKHTEYPSKALCWLCISVLSPKNNVICVICSETFYGSLTYM